MLSKKLKLLARVIHLCARLRRGSVYLIINLLVLNITFLPGS